MHTSQYGEHVRTGILGGGGQRVLWCSSPEVAAERLVRVHVFGKLEELQEHLLDQEETMSTPERLGEVKERRREWNSEGDPWRDPCKMTARGPRGLAAELY